jgi:hypothetical protein
MDAINMRYKKTLSVAVTVILLFYLISISYTNIYIGYLRLFKKDGTIEHINSKGTLDGQLIFYKHGKREGESFFVNGLKNGWRIYYYANGNVKNKMYFKNDTAQSVEYQYYENGTLNYRSNIKNGKRYGSYYWYLNNGKLDSYAVFDIKEETFCLFNYDASGKLIKMGGLVCSHNIYSLNEKNNATVILIDTSSYYNKHRKITIDDLYPRFNNIKDLYFTVATPPDLNVTVNVTINNMHYNNLLIQNNCVKIPNAFTQKGRFDIFIQARLKDKFNKNINGINTKLGVYKE